MPNRKIPDKVSRKYLEMVGTKKTLQEWLKWLSLVNGVCGAQENHTVTW